jgi:hypothetical protein
MVSVNRTVYFQLKLPATTNHDQLFSDDQDLVAHGHDKESLSETSRPDLRPDLSQSTHRLKDDDTLGDILFLRKELKKGPSDFTQTRTGDLPRVRRTD